MDPLTITCAVVTLTAKCLNTAKTLHSFKESYQDASLTIVAMASQCTAMSASLGFIQSLVLKNPDAMQSSLKSRLELVDLFDTCLTGCVIVLSIVDSEVQRLNGSDTVGKRVELLWKESRMKELLSHIEKQQTTLTLLIQALQLEKLDDMSKLIKNNQTNLEAITQDTLSLRAENPTIRSPTSIIQLDTGDNESVFSFACSFASSTQFDFDDIVINSNAYRKTLASLQKPLPVLTKDGETKKAKNVIEAEEIYSTRLQTLSQKCVNAETLLLAAEKDIVRLTTERDAWMDRTYTVNQQAKDAYSALNEELAFCRASIEEKDTKLRMLEASHNAEKKSQEWMASFDEAFNVLRRQYDEVLPEVNTLRQENAAAVKSLEGVKEKETWYHYELKSCRERQEKREQALNGRLKEAYDELDREMVEQNKLKHDVELLLKDVERQKTQLDAKENELNRYRRYDAILDQLRAIKNDETSDSTTNKTAESTPVISPNTSNVGQRRIPIRDMQPPVTQQ